MYRKNSYCSYCGTKFDETQPFPRKCANCEQTTFVNPLPVAVVLLPVDNGLLVVRRGIEPKKGMLALPGGYINLGESWQEAAARELKEETGFEVDPSLIHHMATHSAPDGTLLVFGQAKPRAFTELPEFVPSDETSEIIILREPVPLAFSLHELVVAEYFSAGRKKHYF